MSGLAAVSATLIGVALIALAVRDIFQTVLQPESRGPLARVLMARLWSILRRPRRRGLLKVAGPLGLLAVVWLWALLLVLGWAFLIWPQLEDGFRGVGADPDIWDALYVSLTSVTTLGFGDLAPESDWMRILTPLEALLGFGLLSASISYLLLLYPVLARRRATAYEVSLLREAEAKTGIAPERADPDAAERLYADLTSRVVTVERDLVDFPATYHFTETDDRFSFAVAAPHLLQMARRGREADAPDAVRLRAESLADALDDLAQSMSARFPGARGESTDAVLASYARDHLLSQEVP